jgi:hypothetical protein
VAEVDGSVETDLFLRIGHGALSMGVKKPALGGLVNAGLRRLCQIRSTSS